MADLHKLAVILGMFIAQVPTLDDINRFRWISRAEVQELMRFNQKMQDSIRQHQMVYVGCCEEELREFEHLRKAWDELDNCLCENAETQWRGVINLQKMIGREAFLRGEMPPHIPFWRLGQR